MKSIKDPRHIARILSVMDLYEHFFSHDGEETELAIPFEMEDLELGNYSKKIREADTVGVKEHFEQIDELIDRYSDPVKSVDLDTLQLQIIRVAIYEGFIAKSVPPKVAVDEAIELTRDFGIEMASKKVAGILGKIFEYEAPKPETSSPSIEEKNNSSQSE